MKKNKSEKKTRTYAYWMSICSAILLVTVQILGVFGIYFESKLISDIISSILGVLVATGILIGPINTKQENLEEVEDKKEDEKEIK